MSKDIKATYSATKNHTRALKIQSLAITIFSIIVIVVCLLPIYVLIVNATRDSASISRGISFIPDGFFISNYEKLMRNKEVFDPFRGFLNSAIVSVAGTFFTVFFSALTAYGLTVYNFKLRGPAFTFIVAVLMIPAQVSGIGFLKFMIELKLVNSFYPLILPAIAAPATVFFLRQYMKSSFPLEIVEAARIDGCGEFRTFVQIGLPMCKPAIAVQIIFAFIALWNDYFKASIMLTDKKLKTIPLMIRALSSDRLATDYGVIYVGIFLSIIPMVIVYLIISKYIIAGVALGGVKE